MKQLNYCIALILIIAQSAGMYQNKYLMDSKQLEKSIKHNIVEIIEYVSNAVVSKTIIKKSTGNIIVSSFDAGEVLSERTSPFDTFIQIIDGMAELVISGKAYNLEPGDGIIIPAHAPHQFNANQQFKMISTVIKSGYENISGPI